MKDQKYKVLFHILGVISFLSRPFLFAPREVTLSDMFVVPMGRADLATYILLIVYFYVNYFLLTPSLYLNKK